MKLFSFAGIKCDYYWNSRLFLSFRRVKRGVEKFKILFQYQFCAERRLESVMFLSSFFSKVNYATTCFFSTLAVALGNNAPSLFPPEKNLPPLKMLPLEPLFLLWNSGAALLRASASGTAGYSGFFLFCGSSFFPKSEAAPKGADGGGSFRFFSEKKQVTISY